VEANIPSERLERAQARVSQLLDALRRDTERLTPDVESALTFRPDSE
jgi:hypothetical protein